MHKKCIKYANQQSLNMFAAIIFQWITMHIPNNGAHRQVHILVSEIEPVLKVRNINQIQFAYRDYIFNDASISF